MLVILILGTGTVAGMAGIRIKRTDTYCSCGNGCQKNQEERILTGIAVRRIREHIVVDTAVRKIREKDNCRYGRKINKINR